jgi:hypothetical protein
LPSAPQKHSATLGKERSVKILSAKGSLPSVIYQALGKCFAEWPTLGKDRNEKIIKKIAKKFL